MSDRTGGGPLAGVRVVEIAGIGPAPFCAMLLADLGAEVVRVDRPGPGHSTPAGDVLSRGKRSVMVDLKHEHGPEAVLALVERADVLVEGFRPGVAERLGIGPDDCWQRNPALVYGRMTGWGQDGPLAHTAGHDIDYIALTGMLHAIGRADGPPQVPINLLGDFGGGSLYLAVGILAALLEARGSGRGQVVDAAIVDGSAHLGSMIFSMFSSGGWTEDRGTNLLDTGTPYYDVYETSDGRYMAVGALEQPFYSELVTRLGIAEEIPDRADAANWSKLRDTLATTFRQRTQQEWTELFEGTDACVTPVISMSEAEQHPHLAERGTLVRENGVLQPAPAPRFSRSATTVRAPGRPGAATEAVLADWNVEHATDLLDSGAVVDSGAARGDDTTK